MYYISKKNLPETDKEENENKRLILKEKYIQKTRFITERKY